MPMTSWQLLAVLTCTALVGACGGSIQEQCIETFPSSATDMDLGDPTVTKVTAACARAGRSCDASDFINPLAAACIADETGLDGVDDAWMGTLIYRERFHGPAWRIQSILAGDINDDGCVMGEQMDINVYTGCVILNEYGSEQSNWLDCP